ncbi:hypothetical protein [Thermoleptolyngbya sp. C42_A2020_037]|nr:hypothetical protein [Thermoleptolyngbya sp. C42_A2020_037]
MRPGDRPSSPNTKTSGRSPLDISWNLELLTQTDHSSITRPVP